MSKTRRVRVYKKGGNKPCFECGGNIFQQGGPMQEGMMQPPPEQMMQGQPQQQQQPQMSEEEAQQQQMQQQLMMQVAQLIQQGTKPEKIIKILVKELELEEEQAIQIVQQTVELIKQQAQEAQQMQQMDPSMQQQPMQQQPMMEEGGNPFMPNEEEKDYFEQRKEDFVGVINKTSDIANIKTELEELGLSPKQLKQGFKTGGTPGIGPGIHNVDFRKDDYGFKGNERQSMYEDVLQKSQNKFYNDANDVWDLGKNIFAPEEGGTGGTGTANWDAYTDYLEDIGGGGEGSLSYDDWRSFNQKNEAGQDPYKQRGGSIPKMQPGGEKAVKPILNYALRSNKWWPRNKFMTPIGNYNMTLKGIKEGKPISLGNISIEDDVVSDITGIPTDLQGLGISNLLLQSAAQQKNIGVGMHPEEYAMYMEDMNKLYGKRKSDLNMFEHEIINPGAINEQIRLHNLTKAGIANFKRTLKGLKAKGIELSPNDKFILDNIIADADNFSYSRQSELYDKVEKLENSAIKDEVKKALGERLGLAGNNRFKRYWPEYMAGAGLLGLGAYSIFGGEDEVDPEIQLMKDLNYDLFGPGGRGSYENEQQFFKTIPNIIQDTIYNLDGSSEIINEKPRRRINLRNSQGHDSLDNFGNIVKGWEYYQRGGSLPKAQWGTYPVAKPQKIYEAMDLGSGFQQMKDYETLNKLTSDPNYDKMKVVPTGNTPHGFFGNRNRFDFQAGPVDKDGNELTDYDPGQFSVKQKVNRMKTRVVKKDWRKKRKKWRKEEREKGNRGWGSLSGDERANLAIGALTMGDMFTGAKDRAKQQEEWEDLWSADNMYAAIPADEALKEGHHLKNVGPADLNPTETGMGSFGNYGNIGKFGGSVGDEMYMNEQELQDFLNGGGTVEYLD